MKKYEEFITESLAAEVKSEPKSNAAKEARRLGLTYVGFGRYADNKGQVAYLVDNDKLVPFKGREEVQNMQSKVAISGQQNPVKSVAAKKEANFYNSILNKREKEDIRIINQKNKEIQVLNNSLYSFYNPNMFSEEELDAIANYTADGYEYINSYLYKGHEEGTSADQDEFINNQIAELDSAFEETEAPFAYTVYSGLSTRYSPEKLKADGEYIFRGYVSTSISFETAIDGFAETDWNDTPVVLQIEIAKGQKSIYVDPMSENAGKGETLLPRGSKVKIISGPHLIDDSVVSANPSGTQIHLFHCQLIEDI
jgi:hypothetical protein